MTQQSSELYGLRFSRSHPYALLDRFDEVQELRLNHYTRAMSPRRSKPELAYFVGRLTRANWLDPQRSVGNVARAGQKRANPQIIAAFDERTDRLRGLVYMADNVSSGLGKKVEERLHRSLPKPIRPIVVAAEGLDRYTKLHMDARIDKKYVWTSECVVDDDRQLLVPVLVALGLGGFDKRQPGSWWPWQEEEALVSQLPEWEYKPDGGEAELIEGDKGFGSGSDAAQQEHWSIPKIGTAIANIQKLPGAAEALGYARETLAA